MTRSDRLWAPWRMTYIRQAEAAKRVETAAAGGAAARRRTAAKTPSGERRAAPRGTEECLFCRVAARREDRADLVIARHATALVLLNRFPYNPAHVMVAPLRHVGRFAELSEAERDDVLDLTGLAERALEAEYRPHGMNYGANAGRVAGAGFPGHLHLHLVPRWNGDTNFMPVIGETKVLPESLSRTWTRLRRALGALEPWPVPAPGRRRRGA